MSLKTIASIVFFLCSIFVFSQNWQPKYAEALMLAKEQGKPMIVVFSGSDWCAPCIKLERNIWQSPEFKTYSQNHYILYKADFPRKKSNQLSQEIAKQNAELAQWLNASGHFPLIVVLSADEKVLGKTGYKKLNPDAYISLLNTFIK